MKYEISFDTDTKELSVRKDGAAITDVVSVNINREEPYFTDEEEKTYVQIWTSSKEGGVKKTGMEAVVAGISDMLIGK